MIKLLIPALAVAALPLAGCNITSNATATAITAGICADAGTLQASSVALNKNESTALQGIMNACSSTAGGTVFNKLSVANAIIADAILLQSSGLLKDVHITAQVPADQAVLKKIKMDAQAWSKLAK